MVGRTMRVGWAFGISLWLFASLASAQPAASRTTAPVDPNAQTDAPEEELDAPDIERRELPDYDGREDARPTAGRRLLWIPRIVMAPVWVVTEFLLRRPLGYLVTNVEEQEIPDKVVQFFTFGPENNMALAPTFSFDFGFRPNVGVYFRWNDFVSEGHRWRAGFNFGGKRWLSGALAYRYAPKNQNWEFQIGTRAITRPDGLYFGLGSTVSEDNRSRYSWTNYDANMSFTAKFWRQSGMAIELGYRNRQFGDRTGGRRTIQERIDDPDAGLDPQRAIRELPPGFEEGISIVRQRTRLTLDSRPSRPASGSGVRMIGEYTVGFNPESASELTFVNIGGSVSAFVDLTGYQHVIGVHLSAAISKALAGETPFTELPTLSGNGPMRGFVGNFLSGHSEASLLVDYHWPVWNWLDGTLHVAVGNVYDQEFEGFSLKNQRLSFGVGLAGVSQRDHFFEFLVGFGTDTFENGPDVESVRILFGGTREF